MSDRSTGSARVEMASAIRWFGAAALGFVTLFHLEILIDRWRDASLTSPGVATRWLLSAALLGAFVWLRRRSRPILRSRAGLVLTLAILLLHVGGPPLPAAGAGASDLLFALPVGVVFGLAAIAAARIAASRRLRSISLAGRRQASALARPLSSRFGWHFLPRPPPTPAPLG